MLYCNLFLLILRVLLFFVMLLVGLQSCPGIPTFAAA